MGGLPGSFSVCARFTQIRHNLEYLFVGKFWILSCLLIVCGPISLSGSNTVLRHQCVSFVIISLIILWYTLCSEL
jgi:hypothetical protein